jgi:glucan-binding YG repeat protein
MLTKTGLQNRRAQFAADAAKAMEEYLAEPEAVRVRTARLRALRLERDAAVAAAEAAEQAKKVVVIKKKLMTFRKRVLKPKSLPHWMTTPKPSQADQAHIATAEYWREQNAGNKRMAKLREARLAQEKAGTPKPKRKASKGAHRKTHGFDRWS